MEAALLGAPRGFHAACLNVNKFDKRRLQEEVDLARSGSGEVDSAVAFLFHIANRCSVDATALKPLLQRHTELSAACIETLVPVLAATSAGMLVGITDTLPLPSLLGIDYIVSVPVATSTHMGIGAPVVTLQLRLAHPDGSVRVTPVEFSTSQLKALELSLCEASLALDRT